VVKIGWLQSNIGIQGGAELSCGALVEHAPDWAEVVYCPANKRPPKDIEAFVIQNSTTYGSRWIEELCTRPVIRQVRDPWYAGDAILRRWILSNAAAVVFSSPVQVEAFGYEHDRPVHILAPPVNLAPFREAALPAEERSGAVFVGRVDVYKGAPAAVDWALRTGERLLMIGDVMMGFGALPPYIQIAGRVPYKRMPEVLGHSEKLVFFPEWPEAFGRAVVEAWAAGCELLLRGKIGAQWWIENAPERLGFESAIAEFWDVVRGVL